MEWKIVERAIMTETGLIRVFVDVTDTPFLLLLPF